MTASEPTDPAPVSVLLPTVRWTDACDEVAEQLRGPGAFDGENGGDTGGDGGGGGDRAADELLVICDSPDDPVAARRGDLPDRVRLLVAGEPEGCSGKANAIAAGMEAAANDRIAWTDDDFHHPPEWLATLDADYDRRGPTTEVPVFVGEDPLARLFEPAYVIGGTLAVFAAGVAWGGAVIFERDDLRDGEAAFLRDLRRTVSDDGTLTEHVDVSAVDRTRHVPAGGSLRGSLERFVRFLTITRYHAPAATAFNAVFGVVMAALCLLAPFAGVSLVTALAGAAYARFGIRRATFLLAAPGVLIAPPLMAYAFARRTFVWGGRRYRWRSLFDVAVEPV
ncbi:glycosyltransferase [Halorubrum sp. GN11_10-6_MGM]|uniref:glycosyltransferase n=1 Tax=Halorubrum sp. GN11_10-6_MGM TaxID=2518112 RepID=UPI0010F89AB2|nr:glycosyltransferase [Halorubrum sp. GN11_10-6_MGM]TKX75301.1 glycosyltransferase [Halorubrum sp. GN11_10-6_MGM]